MTVTDNTEAKGLGYWVAAAGIGIAYLTLFTTVMAHVSRPGSNEYGPTLAGILSIALFRRLLRLKSQAASEETFKAGALKHYVSSYGRALLRWGLICVGLGVVMGVFAETAESAGALFGALMGIMIIGCLFAVDVPYRVYRRYLRSGREGFPTGNAGWIVFFVVVVSLWIWRYAPALTANRSASEKTPAVAGPRSAKEVFAAAEKSVVMLESFSALGTPLNQGSGVILGRSRSTPSRIVSHLIEGTDILTNFHVVRNANYVVITTSRGTSHLAGVVYFNEKQDLALLRAPFEAAGEDTRIASAAGIGERVFTISNPQGLGWSLSEGIVSRLPSDDDALVQFTAPVSPGSSGGGLYNERSELVGIITLVLKESQNINFARYLSPIVGAINELRRHPAWPFASLGDGDWMSGFFIADGKPVFEHEEYDAWSQMSGRYLGAEKKINDGFVQALRKSPASAHEARARMLAELDVFYGGQQETVATWHEQYPNDPDAAIAYAEMLIRSNRIDEAKDEVIKALENFPLNVEVTIMALEFFMSHASADTARRLLDELERQFQEGENHGIRFSDSWSNEEFQRRQGVRDAVRQEFKHIVLKNYRDIIANR